MHELPVQPDYHVLSGNCSLESNPDRHDESPLAVANGNRFTEQESLSGLNRVLEVIALVRLH